MEVGDSSVGLTMLLHAADAIWDGEGVGMVVGNFQKGEGKKRKRRRIERRKENEREKG